MMLRWLRDMFTPSAPVQEALEGSELRRAESEEFRARIEREAAPLQRALKANGFEPAVLATFKRRHA